MAGPRADVVVVGAGIVGLSAARELASAGARVVVVERGRVGEEASAAAAGMLTAQVEAAAGSPLFDLALRARDRHAALARELEAETGIGVERSPRGAIEVAFDDAEEAALAGRADWQRARGLAVETLSAADVRDAEPNLSPAVRAGLYYKDDRSVDNVRLLRALAASAVARGAVLLSGRPVTALVLAGGRVAGVDAGLERIAAPVVVNAAGAWAGLLTGRPRPTAGRARPRAHRRLRPRPAGDPPRRLLAARVRRPPGGRPAPRRQHRGARGLRQERDRGRAPARARHRDRDRAPARRGGHRPDVGGPAAGDAGHACRSSAPERFRG